MRAGRYAPYNSPLWSLLGKVLLWLLLAVLWLAAWVWAMVGVDEVKC